MANPKVAIRGSKRTRQVRMERDMYEDLNSDPSLQGLTMPAKLKRIKQESIELKRIDSKINAIGQAVCGKWAWGDKKKRKNDLFY